MYELLIRIETLCLDGGYAIPLVAGGILLVVGLLLWLAGSRFSTAIIAATGAGVGAVVGLAAQRWLPLTPIVSLAIGAAVGCLLGVLFKKVWFFVMAVLVFALVIGGTYSSRFLESPPATGSSFLKRTPMAFSQMNPTQRVAYVDALTNRAEGFWARLQALFDDVLTSIQPHAWKVVIAVVLGGILGVVLIWLIERVVPLVCYSAVGSLLIFSGLACIFGAVGQPLSPSLQGHGRAVNISYGIMVLLGTIVQWLAERRRQRLGPGPSREAAKGAPDSGK